MSTKKLFNKYYGRERGTKQSKYYNLNSVHAPLELKQYKEGEVILTIPRVHLDESELLEFVQALGDAAKTMANWKGYRAKKKQPIKKVQAAPVRTAARADFARDSRKPVNRKSKTTKPTRGRAR